MISIPTLPPYIIHSLAREYTPPLIPWKGGGGKEFRGKQEMRRGRVRVGKKKAGWVVVCVGGGRSESLLHSPKIIPDYILQLKDRAIFAYLLSSAFCLYRTKPFPAIYQK